MTLLTETPDIRKHLQQAKVVAVLGFHPNEQKAAHYVPEYLHRQGLRVIPVNPALAERSERYFGVRAVASLSEIDEQVDIVNVFRRSDKVAGHLPDILGMQPQPTLVWLQLGVQSDEAARELTAAGIDVVQNRCLMVDHRALVV